MKFSLFTLTLALGASSSAAFMQTASFGVKTVPSFTALDVTKEDLEGAAAMVDGILEKTNAGPFFVRLAWHDSGTFDKDIKAGFPKCGGANGSIRFAPEIDYGNNAGLVGAVKLLEPVQKAFPEVSFADIYQMASARGIERAGGPKLGVKYGRVDADGPFVPEGNLPDAEAGDDGEFGWDSGTVVTKDPTPQGHLRKTFYRMGIDDEGIVALSGAHTFGRAYKERSGLGKEKTKFTDGESAEAKQKLADGSDAKYTAGGSSWTPQWLVFDNSYFAVLPDETTDEELLKMSTDKIVFKDDGFRPFVEKFRDSQDAFFESYAKAHKQLSELGAKFEPAEGIEL
mmetsp:Transcript_13742/g.17931  ORF Transcript_13742/g.17931 Transcript_13742/m.17931 type:complete len:341 (+) Transcript_13742:62-1084(+)